MNAKRIVLTLAAGALFGVGSVGAVPQETTFTGYTNGCFSLTCPPPSTSVLQTATIGGLTYTNSTFDVITVLGLASIDGIVGTPNVDNLGSFSLTGAPFVYTGQTFDLRVTFIAPNGTTPTTAVFMANLTGTVLAASNGSLTIDFNNTAHAFTFDDGIFDFFVNDVVDLTPVGPIALSGRIDTHVNAVPEPEAYALIMVGLVAVGFMARRRKS